MYLNKKKTILIVALLVVVFFFFHHLHPVYSGGRGNQCTASQFSSRRKRGYRNRDLR